MPTSETAPDTPRNCRVRTPPRLPRNRIRMPHVQRSRLPRYPTSPPPENQAKVPILETKFYNFRDCAAPAGVRSCAGRRVSPPDADGL
jgi:hypothetical protein